MTRPTPGRIGAAICAASLLLSASASAAAAAALLSTAPSAADAPMVTGTDGYGMQYWFRRGHGCRLVMVFDGSELVRHLPYLKANHMVSPNLTPAVAEKEPDLLAALLAQRVLPVALPPLVQAPGADSCDVVTKVVHTPLSGDGPHTLLSFTMSNAQAQTFVNHIPDLSEIRAKATKFSLTGDDMLMLALESDHAKATSRN